MEAKTNAVTILHMDYCAQGGCIFEFLFLGVTSQKSKNEFKT